MRIAPEFDEAEDRSVSLDLPKKLTMKRSKQTKYKLLKRIGHGGFSEVDVAVKKNSLFRSKDKTNYAIKICAVSDGNNVQPEPLRGRHRVKSKKKTSYDKLENEFEILKEFRDSKYIVHMHEAFLLKNSSRAEVWFVMELMEVDLFEMLRSIRPSLGEISVLTSGILLGLQQIHSKGFIHKDIKLENILVSRKGELKICDFGLAERMPQDGIKTVVGLKGTKYTMAPELFIPGETYTFDADVWSLGVLVSLMLDRKTQSKVFDSPKLMRAIWKYYGQNNDLYFMKLVGYAALDYATYPELIEEYLPQEWLTSQSGDDKLSACLKKSMEYRTAYDFVCRCLVPMPKNGPKKEITRKDVLDRASLEELFDMPLIGASRYKDSFRRRTVRDLLRRFELTRNAHRDM